MAFRGRLIHNPIAGPRDVRRALREIRSDLERFGWSVDLQSTGEPGDATAMAQDAAQAGYDVVIVAGGDGSVSEAVNGLVGTRTALGVLPVGTGNMWAKQLGISTHTLTNPLRLRDAVAGLVEGTVRSVDVGQANGRYFLCWAGIGLDARVTAEVEPRPRYTKRLGALPYVIAAFLVARSFKGVRARVLLDGKAVRGRVLLVLVSNIQQYGGLFDIARRARMDDGLLDIVIFKGLGFWYVVRHVLKILGQRHLHDPRVVYRQARHVEVQTDKSVPVQADGDPIAETPVTVKVVPQALHVLVPPSAPSDLFVKAGGVG